MKTALSILLATLCTGCITRTVQFSYQKGDEMHVVRVRTAIYLSRTAADLIKEELQTAEFISGTAAHRLQTQPDLEAIQKVVEKGVAAGVKAALGLP